MFRYLGEYHLLHYMSFYDTPEGIVRYLPSDYMYSTWYSPRCYSLLWVDWFSTCFDTLGSIICYITCRFMILPKVSFVTSQVITCILHDTPQGVIHYFGWIGLVHVSIPWGVSFVTLHVVILILPKVSFVTSQVITCILHDTPQGIIWYSPGYYMIPRGLFKARCPHHSRWLVSILAEALSLDKQSIYGLTSGLIDLVTSSSWNTWLGWPVQGIGCRCLLIERERMALLRGLVNV